MILVEGVRFLSDGNNKNGGFPDDFNFKKEIKWTKKQIKSLERKIKKEKKEKKSWFG